MGGGGPLSSGAGVAHQLETSPEQCVCVCGGGGRDVSIRAIISTFLDTAALGKGCASQ